MGRDNTEVVRQLGRHGFRQGTGRLANLGRQAVVQHEAVALVLGQGTGMGGGEAVGGLPPRGGREWQRRRGRVRRVEHRPVLGGHDEAGHGQEAAHDLQPPARHDRQRAAQRVGQALEHRGQVGRHHHEIRARRDLDQRAVEIEEEGGFGTGERRQASLWNHVSHEASLFRGKCGGRKANEAGMTDSCRVRP